MDETPIELLNAEVISAHAEAIAHHCDLMMAHSRQIKRMISRIGYSRELADTFHRDTCRIIEPLIARMNQDFGKQH